MKVSKAGRPRKHAWIYEAAAKAVAAAGEEIAEYPGIQLTAVRRQAVRSIVSRINRINGTAVRVRFAFDELNCFFIAKPANNGK